jgi:hypothetical protein
VPTGVSFQAERRWLERLAAKVSRILARQRAGRLIRLEATECETVRGVTDIGLGALRSSPDCDLYLGVYNGYLDAGRALLYGFSTPSRRVAAQLAKAGDLIFPRHHVVEHGDRLPLPPVDTPVLDLRRNRDSVYRVELGASPRVGEEPNSLLATDIAYFFWATAAAHGGGRVPPVPSSYGRQKRLRVLAPPSQRSALSRHSCPECAAPLRSYETLCDRCGWSLRRVALRGDRRSAYDFEQSDT